MSRHGTRVLDWGNRSKRKRKGPPRKKPSPEVTARKESLRQLKQMALTYKVIGDYAVAQFEREHKLLRDVNFGVYSLVEGGPPISVHKTWRDAEAAVPE